MHSYVYQVNVPYADSDSVLAAIRHKVKQLQQAHPSLAACQLADVGMKKADNGVDITLYFAAKSVDR
ncbi:MAG: hypothetical protein ACE3NC_03540 [Candidatus Wallacebacter cryptica]|jgi:hypothetical protein|nr:hypothetical protein [Bacillota bacterium]